MPAVLPRPLKLTRSMRLSEGRNYRQLRLAGRRLVVGSLILNWQPLPAGASSRLGVITSRQVGPAVVRNRARRLLREAFRLHQHDLCQPVAMVLVGRRSLAGRGFAGVERDYLRALRMATLLKTS